MTITEGDKVTIVTTSFTGRHGDTGTVIRAVDPSEIREGDTVFDWWVRVDGFPAGRAITDYPFKASEIEVRS